MNHIFGFTLLHYSSLREYDKESFICPYCLAKCMIGHHFELLLLHTQFTKMKPPSSVGTFWEVREVLLKHFTKLFIPL